MSTHVADVKENTYYLANNKLVFVYKKDENTIYTINFDGVFEDFDITGRLFLSWNKYRNYSKKLIVDAIRRILSTYDVNISYVDRLRECLNLLTGQITETNSKYKLLLII